MKLSNSPISNALSGIINSTYTAIAGMTFLAMTMVSGSVWAEQSSTQAATAGTVPVGRVVISGTVPDEATKAALLSRLQEVYGTGQVVDQLSVGGVIAPANWTGHVQKLIAPNLKTIHKGQLTVDGNNVAVRGEVDSETTKQTVTGSIANSLNPTYTVKNALRVVASSQSVVDQTLANRVIEFENGSAMLTESGKRILDEMAHALSKMESKKIDIIGHTDDTGTRAHNVSLSMARADSVKVYLVAKGLAPQAITTTGMGPDQPLVSNTTDDGRRRNRRIEFRVSQ
ncbi:OOP family OmpA-OmpF porin [Paucimonas lemoignei]|uniref:OOP family OmpA-OmpF porin n=1 Tax=Paucimonas lemoignei TaxID=29443 RepID=A0A4V6NY17_PAULE|nr:OmpA family protein [Paucimonas lemoignei]TCS39470.1 OOP family OmpA-OmpF porin [Paucimonas lemoignei]